jgi:hypothetical protein
LLIGRLKRSQVARHSIVLRIAAADQYRPEPELESFQFEKRKLGAASGREAKNAAVRAFAGSIYGLLTAPDERNNSGGDGECQQNVNVTVEGGGSADSYQPEAQKYHGEGPKHFDVPFYSCRIAVVI